MTEEGYLTIGDYRLYYNYLKIRTAPNEPMLIFLHDSWGCVEMWGDFPEKLTDEFGLNGLVYDRRGYGKSSPFSLAERTEQYLHQAAGELTQVMDGLKIAKAILYGHSDGGTIALIAAAAYPERFRAIVVEGAHSFVEEKGKNAVRESRDKAKHNALLKSLEKFHGSNTEELFRRWHEAWLGDFFKNWTIVPMLKQIQCPVLAFRGENDPFDTEEQIDMLSREIKSGVTVKIIPDAAHTPRRENETETLELIRSFFNPIDF